jgi:hypothetical protein
MGKEHFLRWRLQQLVQPVLLSIEVLQLALVLELILLHLPDHLQLVPQH